VVRVRTRGDLAALINAGSDHVEIKTEICGQGDEDGNEVICIINLDERNNIVNMEDPFGGDDNYVVDEGEDGTEGDEILDETGDESDGEEHVEPAGEGGGRPGRQPGRRQARRQARRGWHCEGCSTWWRS
jgi:hypothetical protein